MIMTTSLSVIVPFHDVAAYAPTTLASLRRNAVPGLEFLLVDDASTDGTAEILAEHSGRLPGARVITCSTNVGLSAARNIGLTHAQGRYLAFLDGDDFVAPGYFPRLVTIMDDLGCDMLRTDHVQVSGRSRSVHRIPFGPRGRVSSPLTGIGPAHRVSSVDAPFAWAGCFHRRVADRGLLDFEETLRTCEDRPWIWRLHLSLRSFAVVGLLGVYYRRDVPTSLSRAAHERQLDFIPAFDQVVGMVCAHPAAADFLPKAVRTYAALVCRHLGRAPDYPEPVRARMRSLSGEALRRLPGDVLDTVLAGMDVDRRTTLTKLVAA
jgi:glycosyltransferase involved in cell wall biosynthesis